MVQPTAQPDAATCAPEGSVVRAFDLHKAIDSVPILQDISLDIAPGRYVALLGANGAGKTTLLKVLATLIAPTSGQLELFGQPLRRDSAAALRSRIGLIGHQSMLYGQLTARENLVFFGRLYRLADARERADALLKRVGLAKRADDPVAAFSRGMVQRTTIARALMHDPELILADEPFTGLDAPSAELLERMLAELHAEGRSILLAHHDIERSLRIAEQAIVLRGGRVVVDRPTNQLDTDTTMREMAAA
jgi:ABC-type multidrug transport system ATPase subunit